MTEQPDEPAQPRRAVIGILALGAIRAAVHQALGRALTERSPRVFTAATRYLATAAGTAAASLAILAAADLFPPIGALLALLLALFYWPVTAFLLVHRRAVRDTFAAADTFDLSLVPGDRSVEGVGVLMTLFAAIGLAIGLIALSFAVQLPTGDIHVILIWILVLLLVARSAYHLRAGLASIRGVTPQAFDNLTANYFGFALATAAAAGVFLLVASHGRQLVLTFVMIGLIAMLLLAWPLVLRRFTRQALFDDLGDDAEPAPFGPAPDRGLTAFGYLLVALGAAALTQTAATALLPAGLTSLLGADAADLLPASNLVTDLLLPLATALLTLWAGLESLRMGPRRTIAIVAYGAATLTSAAVAWAQSGTLLSLPDELSAAPAVVMALAVQVALPLTGLALVRRRLPPRAESL